MDEEEQMKISGIEANFLLFCLDEYCSVNIDGKLTQAYHGYTLGELQLLRDRLFASHEHKEEQ